MKTWTKTDLFGLVLVLFGTISLVFSNSQILTVSAFLLASVSLLYSLYEAKFDFARYRDLLCHYQAILMANSDGWIAWNKNHEYINSSKRFKEFFGFKGSSGIFFSDIVALLNQQDAENLSLAFNKLKKTGQVFELSIRTLDKKNLKFYGSKTLIGGLETTILWCRNVTETLNAVSSIENNLMESEANVEYLREILDTLPIQVWRRNNQLEIVYCNKAYADSLNVTADKVILNNIPLVPGSIFGQGHSLAENVRKSRKCQHISQSIVIDGVRRKITINECPAKDDDLIGYALDITDVESLTSNLDKIVTANCEVLENLSTAIAVFGEDMRLSFFNSAYQRLMKLEPSWLHSKPTYGEILDERRINRQLPEHADFQAFKKSQLALFTSITSPVQELNHLPNGKTLRLLIAPYSLGGLLFMYEDVSDSLSLQRKNNTLLAVQKETLDHLYEGIMVYGSDNRLKIINSALMRIWGMDDCSIEDFKGIHLSEVLDRIRDKLDYGTSWEIFRENAISNLTDRIAKTGKLLKKNNSVILFTYIPLPDGAHMHSFIDITDTCTVEKAVIEKNQILKASQNLRFEFVSSISVELKEPLNSLIGFSELLLNQYFGKLNPKQLEYCKYILSSSNQLNELINNLLEMVSIDIDSVKLRISSFSMKDLLEEVVTGVEKRAQEKNVDIIRNYEIENLIINGDRIRIKQAIFNILINAIQFTPPEGKVNLRLTTNNDFVKIIIQDNGIKQKKCSPNKIFKRSNSKTVNFIDIDSNSVSMPLVKSLIELHGGSLNVSFNEENNSTSVVCSLPIHPNKENLIENEKEFSKKVINL